jgi:uncharacterized iron-regulated membrane protein
MYVLQLIDVIALLIVLSGFYVALKTFRKFLEGDPRGGKPHDRAHFHSVLGIILSAAFFVINVAVALPRWMLRPCS